MRPLHDRFGLRRGIAFDMHERSYEPDLELDLLAAKRRSGRQDCDLVKGACEQSYGFDERRVLDRPLSGFAPQKRGLLYQPGFGAVTREEFGLAFSNVAELAFERFDNASVKRASRFA